MISGDGKAHLSIERLGKVCWINAIANRTLAEYKTKIERLRICETRATQDRTKEIGR